MNAGNYKSIIFSDQCLELITGDIKPINWGSFYIGIGFKALLNFNRLTKVLARGEKDWTDFLGEP